MATAKPTLNPLTDTPTNKTQVTKPFMLAFIKSERATDEDRAWFKAIVADPNNQKEYFDQIHNKTYIDINIPVVRKAFIARFLPHLNKKSPKKSFIEEILSI